MLIEKEIGIDLEYSFEEINNEEILTYAKSQLPHQGVFQCDETLPYAYLKVHDDYIHQLFPLIYTQSTLLKSNHVAAKPDYFSDKNSIGAHISLVYADEKKSEDICEYIKTNLKNSNCTFEIGRIFTVSIFEKTIFALTISSPYLATLRERFGLSQKLNYKGLLVPFHITIAIGI